MTAPPTAAANVPVRLDAREVRAIISEKAGGLGVLTFIYAASLAGIAAVAGPLAWTWLVGVPGVFALAAIVSLGFSPRGFTFRNVRDNLLGVIVTGAHPAAAALLGPLAWSWFTAAAAIGGVSLFVALVLDPFESSAERLAYRMARIHALELKAQAEASGFKNVRAHVEVVKVVAGVPQNSDGTFGRPPSDARAIEPRP